MNSGYTLLDVVQFQSSDPDFDSFAADTLKRSVRVGDIVSICVEKKSIAQTENPARVEVLRVRVDGVNWPFFDAIVLRPLDLQKYHGVQVGDTICFEKHHILDVLNSKDPYAKQKTLAIAQYSGISREFLAEVTPADLSKGRTIVTELDEFTTVLLKRNGNAFEAMIAVELDEDERYNVGREEMKPYALEYSEAANRLQIPNLLPDFRNMNPIMHRSRLIINIPMPNTGQGMIEAIVATIEKVHHEVRAKAGEPS